jgi:hypothetical protein
MNIDFDTLFPDGITDETAAAIGDLLHEFLFAWEGTYFAQLRRHPTRQLDLFDPEAPWRSPPKNPSQPKSP